MRPVPVQLVRKQLTRTQPKLMLETVRIMRRTGAGRACLVLAGMTMEDCTRMAEMLGTMEVAGVGLVLARPALVMLRCTVEVLKGPSRAGAVARARSEQRLTDRAYVVRIRERDGAGRAHPALLLRMVELLRMMEGVAMAGDGRALPPVVWTLVQRRLAVAGWGSLCPLFSEVKARAAPLTLWAG